MQIKILFDKEALNKKLHTGWGVSFLIDDRILFDTGEKGEWLVKNMRALGVDIKKIEAVVISHDHWDHTGGLWEILKERKGLKVYSCPGFSQEFKDKVKEAQAELIEAGKFTEISQNIFITGEIAGAYNDKYMPEQAVVLKTENGITVITGCAHPGIEKIVITAKRQLNKNIYLVVGGLHLKDSREEAIGQVIKLLRENGVQKIAPMHCTGKHAEKLMRKEFGEGYIRAREGDVIEL